MRHFRTLFRAALLAGLACAVPAGPLTAHVEESDSCETAKRTNAWCTTGNVGYVASVPIHSRFLFEVLDAHGHEIIKSRVTCEVCRRAIETDGFCPAHKMGYVHGEAFMSPITYRLARAERIDPATVTCPVCRKNMQGIGWCEKDQRGVVGTFAVTDRAEYDALDAAYRILLRANAMVPRCENCAGAIITDGYCAIHRVTWRAGEAVSGTPPGPAPENAPHPAPGL
ncbi:MAG TPA: hypothetical protein VJV75_09780 [Candidatus Polarisedimenticolia bacterium]|nr:hypothetical protein [Candidatus Polarisedimenticolia bacterium]